VRRSIGQSNLRQFLSCRRMSGVGVIPTLKRHRPRAEFGPEQP
jgi:hypothetical protein